MLNLLTLLGQYTIPVFLVTKKPYTQYAEVLEYQRLTFQSHVTQPGNSQDTSEDGGQQKPGFPQVLKAESQYKQANFT
jgi:hypothetical protein